MEGGKRHNNKSRGERRNPQYLFESTFDRSVLAQALCFCFCSVVCTYFLLLIKKLVLLRRPLLFPGLGQLSFQYFVCGACVERSSRLFPFSFIYYYVCHKIFLLSTILRATIATTCSSGFYFTFSANSE